MPAHPVKTIHSTNTVRLSNRFANLDTKKFKTVVVATIPLKLKNRGEVLELDEGAFTEDELQQP